MSIADVAESLAIDRQDHSFKEHNRLADPFDTLEICSGLATYSTSQTVLSTSASSERWKGAEIATSIRLEHYSVREYVVSRRILDGAASMFHISEAEAQSHLSEICLAYLLSFG